jgi:hypothetical protein
MSRCGLNEQVSDDTVLGRNNHEAIGSISINNPSSEEKRGSLVGFPEGLSSRHAKRQDRRRVHTILHAVQRRECPTQSFQIVGFIEPFVLASYGAIKHHRKIERGPNQ